MPPPPRPDRPIRWRSRPALLLAGRLAAGILAAHLAPAVGFWGWIAAATAAAPVAVAATRSARRRLVSLGAFTATLALGVALTALGGARMAEWQQLPGDHV